MSDIDQIISGGANASSRADFSKLADLPNYYWKGRDEFAKNDLRDAFKSGVPLDASGQPDFAAIGKTFFEKGAFDQGLAASNADIQRQGLRQNQEAAMFAASGQPGGPSISVPPSASRVASSPVAPALQRGGAPGGSPGGGAPGGDNATLMQVLSAQGIPNDQLGPASDSVSRQLGMSDPNAPININDPQVRNVLVPAVQQLKRMGIGQVVPDGAPAPTSQQSQGAPSPFQNAISSGLIPSGVDPARFVAGLKYRAAALPKGPAQETIQSQLNAIDKASELTQGQRDFNASQANPKIDDYAAQQEAAKSSAKGVAEADVKEQNELIASGKQASQRLATLNTISNIIDSDKTMRLGFGAEAALKVKKALEGIGFDVGDLSGPQAIQKLNAMLASESAKAISARPAQFEFKTFLGNNPGLDLDKAGNQRVLGIFSQLAKRDVDLGRLARQNRGSWENWDSVVQKYDKENPIRDPSTSRTITTDSIVAPGPKSSSGASSGSSMTFSSPNEVHAAIAAGKLKSGDAFKTSDGRTKYVP